MLRTQTNQIYSLALPELNNVKGGFNVESTASTLDCSDFKSEAGGVIQGTFKCDTTSNPTVKGSGTKTSGQPGATSSGAAVGLGAGAVAGLGLVGSMMQMLL
jgi:hypothetical protein